MIDKQIIIDGVDVSGCKRIISNKIYGYVCNCEEDTHLISSCKHRPDCYFKQLARKTQECEVLQMSDNEAKEIIAELEAECEELRRSILKIFACLIKANKDKIIDTLWVDNVTTLWDYIAQTLGIEGDQNQIEEKVKMFKEVSDDE